MKTNPLEEKYDSALKSWVGFILMTRADRLVEEGTLRKEYATSLFNHRDSLPDCGRRN